MASWGITVQADLISEVKTPEEFNLVNWINTFK